MTAAATGGRGVESLGGGLLTRTHHHVSPRKSQSPEGAVVALSDRRERNRLRQIAEGLHKVPADERGWLFQAFMSVVRDPRANGSLQAAAAAAADAIEAIAKRGASIDDTVEILETSMREELDRLAARAGQG